MATGAQRDEKTLGEGLRRWVSAHPELVGDLAGPGEGGGGGGGGGGGDGDGGGGPGGDGTVDDAPLVHSLTHASGGLANETVLVDLGPRHPGIVVRLPPLEPTFPAYDLGPQAAVQNAVAHAGVPAPSPSLVVHDVQWVGSPFLVMPRVSGDIPGAAPFFDPYVRDAGPAFQRVMHDELIDTLAAIHAVPWEEHRLGECFSGVGLHDALQRWEAYVAWSSEGDPLPALAQALDWCRRHAPEEGRAVLLWGDVRLGNLVFGSERQVTAVLDWDLAGIGPPEMDLGWHFGLDFMMEVLFGGRLPGFPGRLDALERYERHSGHEVRDLAWHEVFALVRALAVNDRHQRIAGAARRRENPMGDVLLARLEAATAGG